MELAADRAQKRFPLTGRRWALAAAVALFGAAAGTAGWLASQAVWPKPRPLAALWWFDPYFLGYNLFLAAFAVLIVPAVVYFYVRLMSNEKCRRLEREMTAEEWRAREPELRPLVERQFRVRNYVGSVLAAMAVIAAGVLLLLLSKPYLPDGIGVPTVFGHPQGIDYGRGANVLLLGPFIERYAEGTLDDFYHQLVISLTAFQFGFLGAYVYFVTSLLRSYFTIDLSTHTVVAGTIRMVTSSVLALVLSFALPGLVAGDAEGDTFLRTLPVFAFFIGYFPNRGLLWLERMGTKMLGLGRRKYRQTLLSNLTGISSAHEVRFEREGLDNVENLAHADALELAVRTGFGYAQLRDWIGEARLRLAMGADFELFAQKTWLRTEPQVRAFYAAWNGPAHSATRHLAEACGEEMKPRIRNLALLLGCERPDEEEGEGGE